MARNKIYSVKPGKLLEKDLCEMAAYLVKAGYTVRITRTKTAKGVTHPFIEYWVEDEEKPAADA